ncbi:common plant regulatory factor 1-like isoform X2 [Cornus florida]|uniref:common plant regulatory factor 1-like isoform X2 n=1 Tax=Cornus florida TaxID=4283 RepID=UPI002899B3D8|nr:common plant regulatory factor 1-like isoform X2 [Cornus florida]
MGSGEDNKSSKSEKASPSAQAYYGPGVPLPPQYFNSPVTEGQLPQSHMWASPQQLMSPYGVPYPTIYSHGVVYAHPAVPLVATPVSTEMHTKLPDSTDQGLEKKLKRLDGLGVPVGKDTAEADAVGTVHETSQSVERGSDASSDGSDVNTRAHQSKRRSNSMSMLLTENNVKDHTQDSPIPKGEAHMNSTRVSRITVAPENVSVNPEHPFGTEAIAACAASTAAVGLPFEVPVQDERQLKRERRKQANRESARRSRLRKQAETEELMMRYESLKVENLNLKSEIKQLTEESEKVRLENAALMEKLDNSQLEQPGKIVPDQNSSNLALLNIADDSLIAANSDSVGIIS